jgi:putative ABC transport system ATP-binding protein
VLFGLPVAPADDMRGYARIPLVAEALTAAGARHELEAIGRDIAEEFATLVETVGEGSSVLDSFPAYPKADILAAAELVRAYHGQPPSAMKPEQRETLLVLALAFVQTRDRLDVLDEGRIDRLMAAQLRARAHLQGRAGFVFFDEDRFNPGRSVAENILNAKLRHDRKAAWKQLAERMEAAIRAAGLRDELIRLGLGTQAGSGGANLSATARRRVALVRALLKRPQLVILDGVASGGGAGDRALRAVVRDELPQAAFVFAADDPAIDDADLRVEIDAGGSVRYELLAAAPDRGRADGTTGREAP